jgi:Na+-transporting NADH:ubiquinone oxidoreductase subunit NqrD
MNEQMLEFADEAGFMVEEDNIFADDCFDAINDQLQTFAELIIKECIRLGEESQYKCRTFPVSVAIKDHFGIK